MRRRVIRIANKLNLLRRAVRALRLAALLALPFNSHPAAADPVTEWTALADQIGRGRTANWHTLAIMHRAMHDAGNTALPDGPGGHTETRPFMFRDLDDAAPVPPPPPGREAYRTGVEEVRRLGAQAVPGRTKTEAETAVFWAYQLPQRGIVQFAAGLLDGHPRRLGQLETARIMS